ncbi:MAG: zf-HC2 domain-containing protein [Rhizobiales bacterium]|nr:zf-HC2 domain-containing protein [Hyphomicrobiales bacterium]
MTNRDRIHCEEVIAHLLAYLDGEIDAEKRRQIDHHLEECRACFSRAEFEKALRQKVKQLGHEKSPHSLQKRLKGLIDRF